MQINDNRKISEIQEEFNTLFPYLRLTFFGKTKNGTSNSYGKRNIPTCTSTIGECRTIHNNGILTIKPDMTVLDLDQEFKEIYGIHIQVLRKSGKAWLETTVTDGWTLEEQNRQGEALSALQIE